MKSWSGLILSGIASLLVCCVVMQAAETPVAAGTLRTKAQKLRNDGNYKEALEVFKKLVLDRQNRGRDAGSDVDGLHYCLQRLGRLSELDVVLEKAIDAHTDDWQFLQAASRVYASTTHYGYTIAGEYHRGRHRGGGKRAYSHERDRIRALQLLEQAREHTRTEKDKRAVARFYLDFADYLLQGRQGQETWRLQYLSNIAELPDYDEMWHSSRNVGTPVDEDGKPIFFPIPKSWDAARNDGERWRLLLMQAMELDSKRTGEVLWRFSDLMREQYGVQTMGPEYGAFFTRRVLEDDGKKHESGTYDLHRLGENETITRFASGIRRHTLPDEFSFVRVLKRITTDPDCTSHAELALNRLAEIFENRRQYDAAAKYWAASIRRFGPGSNNWKRKREEQILGNWGRFDGTMTHPAGTSPSLGFVFRNGARVDCRAQRIKVPELLNDVKAYIKSQPKSIKWDRINISNIGYRLVRNNEAKYVGETVAQWDLRLDPRERHWDRRIDIVPPFKEAGAYLLTATMKGGNTSHVVVWLNDTVIVKKQLDVGAYYFVADAVSGTPIAKANLEFFGYRTDWNRGKAKVQTQQFAEFTDAEGQAIYQPDTQGNRYSWLVTATHPEDGRFAYLGFSSIWSSQYREGEYKATKVFTITDRPVYRPEQKVFFKAWVRHAQYDQDDTSQFANRDLLVRITNPRNEKVLEKRLTTGLYGGLNGKLELAEDAVLGVYRITVTDPHYVDPGSGKKLGERQLGSGNFRVEEYKKPEFEVKVRAPKKPIMLGEKITATIEAKYYFGAPVTQAKVKYKVLRSEHSAQWFPPMPWDWFYGRGYWWFAYDYDWYPGWEHWGCRRPWPWWWPRGHQPPEVISDNEVEIGEDGMVKVEIDTSLAKAMHGDTDHKYEITAEVVDASRRTIVGKGSVLVARKPFHVYAWTDRGHYRVGDVVKADFSARTLDQMPVTGAAKVTLYSVSYDEDRTPVETAVRSWDLRMDGEGKSTLELKASRSGQYRLACHVTDSEDHRIEGGVRFCRTRGGLRRQAVPLRSPGARQRQTRLPAGRESAADGQHRSPGQYGSLLRPPLERGLP